MTTCSNVPQRIDMGMKSTDFPPTIVTNVLSIAVTTDRSTACAVSTSTNSSECTLGPSSSSSSPPAASASVGKIDL